MPHRPPLHALLRTRNHNIFLSATWTHWPDIEAILVAVPAKCSDLLHHATQPCANLPQLPWPWLRSGAFLFFINPIGASGTSADASVAQRGVLSPCLLYAAENVFCGAILI